MWDMHITEVVIPSGQRGAWPCKAVGHGPPALHFDKAGMFLMAITIAKFQGQMTALG